MSTSYEQFDDRLFDPRPYNQRRMQPGVSLNQMVLPGFIEHTPLPHVAHAVDRGHVFSMDEDEGGYSIRTSIAGTNSGSIHWDKRMPDYDYEGNKHQDREVGNITVRGSITPENKGLGTALYEAARAQAEPPNHSSTRTPFGEVWTANPRVLELGGRRPVRSGVLDEDDDRGHTTEIHLKKDTSLYGDEREYLAERRAEGERRYVAPPGRPSVTPLSTTARVVSRRPAWE